jgi:MFS family permease
MANQIPILFSVAGNVEGIEESMGVTAVATFGYFGLLAGPAIIGMIADLYSYRVALSIFIGVMFYIFLCSKKIIDN